MKNNEVLLKGICDVVAKNIVDLREHNTHPKHRDLDEIQKRYMYCCLWHVSIWNSSKRKYWAKKLQDIGAIKIRDERKGSPTLVDIANDKIVLDAYEDCKGVVSDFDFKRGNGWISYPQLSKTEIGKKLIECISVLIYNKIAKECGLEFYNEK